MAIYNYIDATGTIQPDTQTILDEVTQDYLDSFGADLVTTPDTPQGMLIATEAENRSALVRNNSALANQINPNLAGGVFLDAIWALTGGKRDSDHYSFTLVNLFGVATTVVPAGSTLRNANGEIFASDNDVILDSGGEAIVNFTAINPGPIAAPANTLTQIANMPLGVETATNPNDATLGFLSPSDESTRALRRNTLALQGSSLAEAVLSGLYVTQGVQNAKFRENWENITRVIDGVTMNPNSMYACVDGGTNLAVATTILQKKGGGCGYTNGAGTPVSQIVVDPASGQNCTILFDRPILKPVLVKAFVRQGQSTENPTEAVKQAILSYANGLIDGESGFVIGASVSCFELSGAVTQQVPGIYVQQVQSTLAAVVNYTNAEIPIAIFEKATIQYSSIIVVLV